MEKNFIRRGYHKGILREQINKAITTPREITLQKTSRVKTKRIPLVTTFNSTLPQIGMILKERWDILHIKPQIQALFPEPPIVALRRSKNLREIIGSNTISNSKVQRRKAKNQIAKYCFISFSFHFISIY